MNEKCFCHIGMADGTRYKVKDADARESISELETNTNEEISKLKSSFESINIKSFGAVGDGVTNDTQSIQDAINYASTNGKSVFIPNGTYLIDSIDVYGTGIKVVGESKKKTILKDSGSTTKNYIVSITGMENIFENITIEGSNDGTYDANEHVKHGVIFENTYLNYCGLLKMSNINIKKCSGDGIHQTTNINGYLADSIFYNIRCTDNNGCGADFGANSDFNIESCWFANNRLDGLRFTCSASRIINCKSYLNGVGIFNGNESSPQTRYAGFYIKAFGTSVIGCHAQENYGHGFDINECMSCDFTGNVSDGNGIIGFPDDWNLNNRVSTQRKSRSSATPTNNYAGFNIVKTERSNIIGSSVLSFINTNTYGVQMSYCYYISECLGNVIIGQGSVDNTSLYNNADTLDSSNTITLNSTLIGAYDKFTKNNNNVLTIGNLSTGATRGSFPVTVTNWSLFFAIFKIAKGGGIYDTICVCGGRTNNGLQVNKVSQQDWYTIDVDASAGTFTINVNNGGFYGVNEVICL